MIRRILLFASALCGVYLSVRLVEHLAGYAGHTGSLELMSGEGVLLVVPVALIGAVLGAFFGGLFLPVQR